VSDVLAAPAKLTWTLRITGVRADGYHLIDAEMTTLDLADELVVERGGSGIEVTGPYARGVPVDDSNLVTKALRRAGVDAAARIDPRRDARGAAAARRDPGRVPALGRARRPGR
jgi:4-diphosphocytidyl-2-C-methyl-D-erythritol kinase